LSASQFAAYVEAARGLGKLGPRRRADAGLPPGVAGGGRAVRGDALAPVLDLVKAMQKSPNGGAIAGFLQTLAPVARRLQAIEQLSFTSTWCAT
jgi:nitric oxide reductase NorD protein